MPSRDVFIAGAGHVGLTAAAAFLQLGHRVRCIDADAERIAMLQGSAAQAIREPGVAAALQRGREGGRLALHTRWPPHPNAPAMVIIAVGTPPLRNGATDLSAIRTVASTLRDWARPGDVVVVKSTVPVGTGDWIAADLAQAAVVSNPEFLREGSALHDFLHPDRVVVGGEYPAAVEAVVDLHRGIEGPVLRTDRRTAEMIKYASNAYLATRVSFVNELAALCEQLDVDVALVSRGMGMDRRIGPEYLRAGVGYGGSCLPKDVASLLHQHRQRRTPAPLLRAVAAVNEEQPARLVGKLRRFVGRLAGQQVAVLGLAFKPGTDDVRHSPALAVLDILRHEGARTRACDPLAADAARRVLSGVEIVADAYECANGADGLILVTDWEEYRRLDLGRLFAIMRQPVLIDGRNAFDPRAAVAAGFFYAGVGRAPQPRLPGDRR